MKYSGIGGQAVIEGIMMKNKDDYATAVRRPDGVIEVKKDTYVSLAEKVKFFSLPFGFDDPRHEESELFGELFRG